MKNRARYDVVILGGGPAGCATAIALRKLGDLRILIVESGHYDATRIGESIPPDTRSLFQKLGIWDDFQKEQYETCLGSCSSWGDSELGYNDFLFNPYGSGWHLNRRRFDLFLARKARQSGAKILTDTKYERFEPIGKEGFSLRLSHKNVNPIFVDSRFVVDATGMRSGFARSAGAKRRFLDRLICVCGYFEIPDTSETSSLTMLEAVEDGWWYTAKLPGGESVVAFASDPETINQMNCQNIDNWLDLLSKTNHVSGWLERSNYIKGSLQAYPVLSYLLDKTSGKRWLAAGDAASAYDPISSQGIYKALQNGIDAAYAINSFFKDSNKTFTEYESSISTNFDNYLKIRNYFYRLENRWHESPFWQNRRRSNALN